jgi:hypothetical protein
MSERGVDESPALLKFLFSICLIGDRVCLNSRKLNARMMRIHGYINNTHVLCLSHSYRRRPQSERRLLVLLVAAVLLSIALIIALAVVSYLCK